MKQEMFQELIVSHFMCAEIVWDLLLWLMKPIQRIAGLKKLIQNGMLVHMDKFQELLICKQKFMLEDQSHVVFNLRMD